MSKSKDPIRFALVAAALVLGLRCLYLARFGWDGCWMNYNFLLEAKAFALGQSVEAHGLPLTPLLLWTLRRVGMSPLASLGAVYLIGQALFLVAAMALFRFFEAGASQRKWILFVVVVAVIPILSTDTAYKDVAVLLGAGLLLSALACALAAAATTERSPVGLLVMAVSFAALGGACRAETVAGTASMAMLLLVFGRSRATPIDGVSRPLAAGLALGVGTALGLLLLLGLSFVLRGEARISSPAYRFYTFFDGLPVLMLPSEPGLPGEYGRYLASIGHFGGFAEHHGSVLSALLAHPGKAFLRFALKLPELLVGISWMGGITPVGVVLVLVGLRASWPTWRAPLRSRSILLLAFLGPLAVLLIPPAYDLYFLSVLFPVLLAITAGLDRLLAGRSEATVRVLAASCLVAAALWIGAFGRTEPSNSRAINQAAAYLETECRAGCLLNYLPSMLSSQAWVDLEAGVPFPPKIKRSEDFVLGRFPAGYEQDWNFEARARKSRREGYRGPVLYLDMQIESATVFNDAFDPEHRFDGHPDLSRAILKQRFEQDGDVIAVYQMPDAGDAATDTAAPAGL